LWAGFSSYPAAASVMALGLDPRFDLTKAYWVVAGIGGVDPADVSLGSATLCQPTRSGAERVGDKVVRDIVEHWAERESNLPHAPQ
jgi:purine nucleoside permease